MQGGVSGVVGGAGVAAPGVGDFDPIKIFDVCTIVEFAAGTGRRVADDQSERAAPGDRQGFVVQAVDDGRLGTQRGQRDRDVVIVAGGMERDMRRIGIGTGLVQQGTEPDSIAAAVGVES